MREHPVEIVGTDIDGTLIKWMEAYVPAYEAMCEALAEYSGKSYLETESAMKAFYTAVGSLENEGLVQGLYAVGFFKGVRNFDIDAAIDVAKIAFSKARLENIALYDGVPEAIHEITSRVPLFALSDGPVIQVRNRMKLVGILDDIPHVYGTQSAVIPNLPDRYRRDLGLNPDFVVGEEKPFTKLELVLDKTRAEIGREVAYIGDSVGKDIGLVHEWDMRGVLAKWSKLDMKLVERLSRFAPDTSVKNHMKAHGVQSSRSSEARIHVAESPMDVPKILFGLRK